MFLKLFSSEIINTIHLGIGFLLIFSADFTLNNLMPTLYKRIAEDNPEFTIDGFVGLGGLYFIYGVSLWFAPSINGIIGPKIGMVIGALCVTSHVYVVEFEIVWLVYLGILLSGFGGALLWVGEGNYIVRNSKENDVAKHVSIFWSLYTGSMVIGNLFMTLELGTAEELNRPKRQILLRILSGIGLLSAITFAFLRKPKGKSAAKELTEGPVEAFVKTVRLYMTKNMILLCFTFIYAGFQQSFGWGILATSMGFTKKFGPESTRLVPLTGLVYGLGNSIGGGIHLFISHHLAIKYQRGMIICTSGIVQIVALILTFAHLSDNSVFGPTFQPSLIEPSKILGLSCSFVLGFGDSCLNTQIFALLAHLHPDHSAHTSALFKFTKCMAIAGFFFVGISLGLHTQILIIVLACVAGTFAFFWVDYKTCNITKDYPVCIDLM